MHHGPTKRFAVIDKVDQLPFSIFKDMSTPKQSANRKRNPISYRRHLLKIIMCLNLVWIIRAFPPEVSGVSLIGTMER